MTSVPNNAAQKKGRKTLIAILLVSALPVVAAWFVFFTGVGMPGNTVNAGNLLSKAVHVKTLLGEDSPQWQALDQDRKWRLFIPVGAKCGADCEQNLYTTRQVHIRLGEKSVRVARVAVNIGGDAGAALVAAIEKDHPRMKILNVDGATWAQWVAGSGSQLDNAVVPYYLLVDQEGYAMMYYTTEQHGNELLEDLKRALKFSIDYE